MTQDQVNVGLMFLAGITLVSLLLVMRAAGKSFWILVESVLKREIERRSKETFEYSTIEVSTGSPLLSQEILNNLGSQGKRLVSVTYFPNGDTYFVFEIKRIGQ